MTRNRSRIFIPILHRIGVFALVVGTGNALAEQIKYNQGDPMDYGIGFNTLTGKYAGRCLVQYQNADIKTVAAGDVAGAGQSSQWYVTSVDNTQTLAETLDASASISVGFLFGSASASSSYLHSREFNSYHQFLVLQVHVVNGTRYWDIPDTATALPKNLQDLKDNHPLDFLNRCGNTYVRTITTGGEFDAVLDVSTSALDDRSALTVNLSGNYGTGEGKAQLKEKIEQTYQNRQVSVRVVRAGGKGSLPSFSAADLISASLGFGADVAANPVPASAELAPYDTIYVGIGQPPDVESFIMRLFRAYMRALQYNGDLAFIRMHTSDFRKLAVPREAAYAASLRSSDKHDNTAPPERFQQFVDSQLTRLTDSSQPQPNPGDFEFRALNSDEIEGTIEQFEDYTDTLNTMARECFAHPDQKCHGDLPTPPKKIANVVRVAFPTVAWDTRKPVNINLDTALTCKVDNVLGRWQYTQNSDWQSCGALPNIVTNGHIVSGDFDTNKAGGYEDNNGVCTYQFICMRR